MNACKMLSTVPSMPYALNNGSHYLCSLGQQQREGLACFLCRISYVSHFFGSFALTSGHLKATEMFHSYFLVLHKFIQQTLFTNQVQALIIYYVNALL